MNYSSRQEECPYCGAELDGARECTNPWCENKQEVFDTEESDFMYQGIQFDFK